MKKFLALNISDVIFIMPINIKINIERPANVISETVLNLALQFLYNYAGTNGKLLKILIP